MKNKILQFLLLLLLILPANAYAQRDLALNQSIAEGTSMAGIKIGDSESEIYKVLGFPDQMESSFLTDPRPSYQGLKFLLYGLDKGDLIFIFTRYGKVEAIQVLWAGLGQDSRPAYKGKTTRGIGLGDKVEDVKRYYGGCKMSGKEKMSVGWLCWDTNAGILLGADAGNFIRLIGIISPGKELPDYLKPENQHF